MDSSIVEDYQKAAQIHNACMKKARDMAAPGITLLTLAEEIEGIIESKGAKPGFPPNLSLNDVAAHYTPSSGDKTKIADGDVLKVDIGVQVNGYLIDSAMTLNFSKDKKMKDLCDATKEALEAALKEVKEGMKVGDIGKIVEDKIKEFGMKPIQNLSGHGVDRYTAHCAPSIPNIATSDLRKLEEGKAYAIEPFASTGEGWVKEGSMAEIFEIGESMMVRNATARKMLEFIIEEYEGFPFAERYLDKMGLSDFQRKTSLRELLSKKCLISHPVLLEEKGSFVSQHESTILINNHKVIRLV